MMITFFPNCFITHYRLFKKGVEEKSSILLAIDITNMYLDFRIQLKLLENITPHVKNTPLPTQCR
jgi:hypothetical protein